MQENKSRRRDNAHYQNNPIIRRGRFIAPIVDLSAIGGFHDIQIKKLNSIIAPAWGDDPRRWAQ
jgi:hypothetical protein